MSKPFQRLNKAEKFLLKMRDREAYRNYKFEMRLQELTFDYLKVQESAKDVVSFRHSGNAGDIIYAIPAMRALANGKGIRLFLRAGEKIRSKLVHPLGNVMLNNKMVEMLIPLLERQNIQTELYEGQEFDVDLDIFRDLPINHRAGSLPRWYFLTHGITADLGKPWLDVPRLQGYADHIILARSQRYRNPGIDYSFLSRYKKVDFIGVDIEYREMKTYIPHLQHVPVQDFLQMASVILSGKLFIGNQSFPFSIAEGLKVPRILEQYHLAPNVIVEGEEGYDFLFQPQFEMIVRKLMAD